MDANIQEAIRSEVDNAVKSSQDQLLNSLTAVLDTRLGCFQRSIQDNQKTIADNQMAKIDESMADSSYKFKRRGNEEQFKHNHRVFMKVKEAGAEMETDNLNQGNINNAKRKIAEGLDLIRNRQKLIKLADSSDAGWRVVDEYVSNPLAEDSDDEKKIYKAQSRAESKLKKEKSKTKTDQRPMPYKKTTDGNTIPVSSGQVLPGRCFYCHESGHWIRQCPKMPAEQKNKISIANSICNESNIPFHTEHVSRDFDSRSICNTHTTIDSKNNTNSIGKGVGHLKENIEEWKNIGASQFVTDTIENGYKIPFVTIPPNAELKNNKSARDNPDFVTAEIEKLLEKGCIKQVNEKPHVINPLTVANNKGAKLRLVLDARHINPHILKFKYKYEDANTARQMFEKEDYIFSYDLKSAYHHISIFNEDTTYLGFKWNNTYYVYTVLPFGLSTSGYVFSKVVREIVKHWRGRRLNIIMYLDDGLGGGNCLEDALSTSNIIKSDLERFGFTLAHEKYNWYPVQCLEWLGFVWDMSEGILRITNKRFTKFLDTLEKFLNIVRCGVNLHRVRFIASIVGQIISMQAVLGDHTRLRSRYLYNCILLRASWNAKVLVSTEAVHECVFWYENVRKLNEIGSQLSVLTYNQPQDLHIFCDASSGGFGGHLTAGSEDEPSEVFGTWSENERVQSSTWRELEAVNRVIRTHKTLLQGVSLNKNVEEAIRHR